MRKFHRHLTATKIFGGGVAEAVLYQKSKSNLGQVLDKSFVAHSKASMTILKQVQAVAASAASVMICGESGTGKELIAHQVHRLSGVRNGPFVAVNCAALPDDLLESELFGHKKGSFTGAVADHDGLIRRANGGTLFLDEVGDMSLRTQAKLLRVIQEKKVRPVGGGEEISVDFRIVCATHKNILQMTKTGEFRADLYFRLSVVPLFIPPLRARKDDLLPLAQHFVNRVAAECKVPPKRLSEGAKERLLLHDWSGNVRELSNVIERAMVYSKMETITEDHIQFDSDFLIPDNFSRKEDRSSTLDLKQREREVISEALVQAGGIKTKAARWLGIDRKTLLRKEREYGITY